MTPETTNLLMGLGIGAFAGALFGYVVGWALSLSRQLKAKTQK